MLSTMEVVVASGCHYKVKNIEGGNTGATLTCSSPMLLSQVIVPTRSLVLESRHDEPT